MDFIVSAVLKATFLLVNKCREKVAEKLKDGDVTDQNFRALIMSEINSVKSKLDGLARANLLASINFFKQGIQLLYEVFEEARSRSENGAVTTKKAQCTEACSLAKTIRKLNLTDLDESARVKLTDAKERFKTAREDATRAFSNESLETSDRILAMQYLVMATILEKVDNPADALGTCRLCIEELHGLSAIQESFKVELGKGLKATLKAKFDKAERRKIISDIFHVNFVVYGVTIMACTCFDNKKLSNWPCIGSGEEKVDPLRDERVSEVLREQGMEHCYVTPWSFGQEGEEEHKLKYPRGIATTSSGQFIVGYSRDSNVKVFDSSGTFKNSLSFPNDDADKELLVLDLATDMNDNVYVLVKLEKPAADRDEDAVYKFNKTADLHHKFPVWRARYADRLTVTDSDKVLLLRQSKGWVDVYETEGHLVSLLGKGILDGAYDITAANGGRVMVVEKRLFSALWVNIFSEHGDHLNVFNLQERYFRLSPPQIAFHRASEHVAFVSREHKKGKKDLLHVEIYTKDGDFIRSTKVHDEFSIIASEGMAVTTEGRISVVCSYGRSRDSKVIVI